MPCEAANPSQARHISSIIDADLIFLICIFLCISKLLRKLKIMAFPLRVKIRFGCLSPILPAHTQIYK